MIEYVSTRGGSDKVTSAMAIKKGIASDGGLYMPESIPAVDMDFIKGLCTKSYEERAVSVLSLFLTDYTKDELTAAANFAYGGGKYEGFPAPVVKLPCGFSALELWHGPTAAFKDMALQICPTLLSTALVKTDEKGDAFILVATSGDTGKAALEGYKDVPHTKIMVFYPEDGVSAVQKLQMTTQIGSNVSVCAIKGCFDDAQTGVKKIFADEKVRAELAAKGKFFSSANSINWGRLSPQIVYYFSAYCDMVNAGTISLGEEINVTVPTGNFGNIFAGYIARLMGLPIKRLVCASNMNNILTDFITTGTYDRNREFHLTMSPSMDILISSNLERFLYLAAGSERTSAYMKALSENGKYSVDADVFEKLTEAFSAGYCDEQTTSATVKEFYEKEGYLCDTHTAVALHCAKKYCEETGDTAKMLVVSTASPYKFADSVYTALTGKKSESSLCALDDLKAYTGVEITAPLRNIGERKVRFTQSIDPKDMASAVIAEL